MIYTMDWFFSSTFTEIIKTLLSIDSIIYWLIAQFFRFIIDISSADFIMTDLLNTIIDRAYVVAGVFALFIMSYALIKGLFDPDGVFKGKNSLGQIIKNLLIAIALVALMPTIFTYLFRFQAIIINNNVIGNIVLGTDSQAMKFKVDGKYQEVSVENVGYENYIKVASNNVAFSALNAFVYADDNDKPIDLSEKPTVGMFLTPRVGVLGLASGAGKLLTSITQDNSENTETTFNQLRNNIVITGNFLEINTIAYHVATGGDYSNESGAHVTYLFIVSTICGIAMLFLTFAFCINIVVRMFNLFLLELISPIASFSLVIPNSKIFDNWFKAAMKEYLDLFVRLFTFNLAILFFSNINQIIVQVIEGHGNVGLISIMNILFVIGLLIFINEAPKLVKDILGMKDDKKGIKDRLFSGGVSKTLGGALGLLGGSTVAGIGVASALKDSGATSKFGKAMNAFRGGMSGFGAGKNAAKSKSFGDFTGAVDKGVQGAKSSRQKFNDRAARYKNLYGAGIGGYVKGLTEDAKYYATDTNPTDSYNAFVDQRFHGKMKDTNEKLNDAVKEAKVNAATNVRLGNKDYMAGQEINIKELNQLKESAETAYSAALAGTHTGLSKYESKSDRALKYVNENLSRNLASLDQGTLSLSPTDRIRIKELADDYMSKLKTGDDTTNIVNEMKNITSGYDAETAGFIDIWANNIINGINNDYDNHHLKVEQENAAFTNHLKDLRDEAKDNFNAARDYVIDQKVQTPGAAQNIISDFLIDLRNTSYSNPYITDIEVNGTHYNLKDESTIERIKNDHKFMRDVMKAVKNRQEEFEATDAEFIRAREMRNNVKKDK